MANAEKQDISRRMGRPPLNHQATTIRFPKDLLDRIDNLVGEKGRAKFIREAVEARVKYTEDLSKLQNERL